MVLKSSEQYFDDAKHGLLKDLVDFHNREDFDAYMRQLEKNYYKQLNLPQPPYENLPEFPPKPFQVSKSKVMQVKLIDKRSDMLSKDFIDKVNEANQKR